MKRNYAREALEFSREQAQALLAARKPDTEKAWRILKDAQSNLHKADSGGQLQAVDRITHWMGGGLAVLASITGETPEALRDRLIAEAGGDAESIRVSADGTMSNGKLTLYPVKRERPAPPPGAPRPIYAEDLTVEERIEYGMTLPGDIPDDELDDPIDPDGSDEDDR